ncbi:TIGR03084 family metal-binding protein [Sphingorhabdus sp. Alg239-R122]|uniref:TIGR03084 family metal-binding protein n=1 Tax=Sphingorhabdus sp. Alg239-R122 TaxID=2305989 RepID=UPI0013D9F453|nr:TIGR03084 family metal-binding protein [Sphingorhabdus sp. Alg239-R122]
MQQAHDFHTESDALHQIVQPLSDSGLEQVTAFKGWTINDVIGHLHIWNIAADLSLRDEAVFRAFFAEVAASFQQGSLKDFERNFLENLRGKALVAQWHEDYKEIAKNFAKADPKARLPWAGPSMSARSSITARLMETWAHGQEIYDLLGLKRQNGDHIRGIVVLGVNTFGWTYKNRREDVPEQMPYLVLTAPSGDIWTYGEENGNERIEGLAEEFCQVVTQTRNIADTHLQVTGAVAADWMQKAQCFAGAPVPPPPPGTRVTKPR